MPYVPNEVLLMIAQFSEDDTLKSFRLSNSTLKAFATPIFAQRKFESINVHITARKLKWFQDICNYEPFASHINSITFCTIAPSRKQIPVLASAMYSGSLRTAHPKLKRAIRHLSRYLDEHEELCKSGYMIASLRQSFEALRRTRDFDLRIKISDDSEEEAFNALLECKRNLHIRITDGRKDCFGRYDLHTIAFKPGHVLNGTLYWSESDAMRIMSALTRSPLSPESLSITATRAMAGCSYQSLSGRLDIPDEGGLTHSCDFYSLTSVEIDISSAFPLECTSALASVVGRASNLQNVVLRGWDMHVVGSFERRFRDMEAVKPRIAGLRTRGSLQKILPKQGLKNITLKNLLIEADDLTSFLKANSATLETVKLRSLIICGDIQEFSDLQCDGFPRLQSCVVSGLRNFTGDAIPRWGPPTCC